MNTQNPFDAGTFGHRYFEQVKNLSRDELLRRRRRNDEHLTYTNDDECRRMVVCQALSALLA